MADGRSVCNSPLAQGETVCQESGAKTDPEGSPEWSASSPDLRKRCPQCGAENAVGAKFCSADGYRFDEPASGPVCPFCDTVNPPGAQFCREDGTPLDAGASVASAVPAIAPDFDQGIDDGPLPLRVGTALAESADVLGAAPARRSSMFAFVGALGIGVVAAGLAGYLYWSAHSATARAPTEVTRETRVASPGLEPSADRERDERFASTARADLPSAAPSASGAIASATFAPPPAPQVPPAADATAPESILSQPPAPVRLPRSESAKPKAPKATSSRVAQPRKAPVAAESARPDPIRMEGEMNRALRSAGLRGVNAQVGDDLTVTLKGTTQGEPDKHHALEIASAFKGVKGVKDNVFVVE